MKNIQNKVAVVTGAASGIGRALSESFAKAGCRVVMADVEQSTLEAAAAQVAGETGAEVLAQVVDVSDAAQVEAMRDAALQRFGAVHILCNNAGVSGRAGALARQTALDWKWVLGVNLWGVVNGIQAFLPGFMAQNEGHIVNTGSIAGLISMPNLGPYNVSKHAVVTLSETLFLELQSKASKVGVSVLCPGAVNTRIHEAARNRPEELTNPAKAQSEEQRKRSQQTIEMVGQILAAGLSPEAVAEQVLQAIVADQFYILTHSDVKPLVEQRTREILSESNPGSLSKPE